MKIEVKPNGVTLHGNAVLTGNATFNQDLTILGNLNVITNGYINNTRIATINDISNLSVSNNASFLNGIYVSGAFLGTGNFSFTSFNNNLSINSWGISVNSNMNITGFTTFNGSISVANNSRFNSLVYITGGLVITGDVAMLSEKVYVSGNLNVNNNLVVSGNVSMNTLYISGNTIMNSLLTVSGGLVITGDVAMLSEKVYVSGNLNVNNNLVVSGNVSMNTLYISGNTIMNSLLTVSGGLVITGDVAMLSEKVYVSGNLNINNNLVVTGNVSMNTLYISGNTIMNSLLTVSGGLVITGDVAMLSEKVYVSGNLNINNNLVVTGNVSMNTLYISGNTIINSVLTVSGGLVITGDVTMDSNNIYLSGKTIINGGLISSGNSTFININAKEIYVKDNLTTPVYTTYLDLDNSSTTINITYGTNIYLGNPFDNTINTLTGTVGTINSIDFSGNTIFYAGEGLNPINSAPIAGTASTISSDGSPSGKVNTILYNSIKQWLVIGGTFNDNGRDNDNTAKLTIYDFNETKSNKYIGYKSNNLSGEVKSLCFEPNSFNVWIGLNGSSDPGINGAICLAHLTTDRTLSNLDSRLNVVSYTGTSVNSIITTGTKVYVGGSINNNSSSLFKVNLTGTPDSSNIFNDVPNNVSLNGPINSLAIDSLGNFYIGGSFNYLGSKNIVQYDNSGNWNPIGVGIPNAVNTITIDNNDFIYAGTNSNLYKYNKISNSFNLFKSSVNCKTTRINGNSIYYSNGPNLNYFANKYKNLTFTNPVYDGGATFNKIVFLNSGDCVQISATSTWGTILSKSSNLYINY